MNSRTSGFTLVEAAIVLLILGLLLGGVLRGQELIFNSKIKASFNLTREVSAAMNAYLERYGQLPGDDPQAAQRFPSAVPLPVNGNGDRNIPDEGGCVGGTSTHEQCEALYELRLAGFLPGTGRGPIRTPFGGEAEIGGAGYYVPNMGNALGMAFSNSQMTVRAASAIDSAFDDGKPGSGNWQCKGTPAYDMSQPNDKVGGWCVMRF